MPGRVALVLPRQNSVVTLKPCKEIIQTPIPIPLQLAWFPPRTPFRIYLTWADGVHPASIWTTAGAVMKDVLHRTQRPTSVIRKTNSFGL